MIDIWVTMHDLCLSWVFSLVWNVYDIQSSKLSNPKSVRVGEDGLRPTMGLEGGPGAWWRTRMASTVSSRSINLRPRLGSQQQQPGGRRHPPRQEVPKPSFASSSTVP